MTPSEKYLLAILIKGSAEKELQALRERYAIPAWQPAIPFHITLARPFIWDADIADLEKHIREKTSGHKSFSFIVDGFGRFDNATSVIYARVQPTPAMQSLAKDLQMSSSPFPFTPHVSISAKSTRQQVDEYESHLVNTAFSHTLLCDRFALLGLNESVRRWEILHEFPLQQ